MDLMDIQDISYIDINELGVRPFNWIGGENEIEFDETTNGYFGKEKLTEFSIINPGKKLTSDDDDVSMCDEDDENYDIDPETGEKTLREVVSVPSPAISSSNDKWIEEYLINIESSSSSSSNQLIPSSLPATNSDFFFEDIPFNNNPTDSNWFSKYISLNESTNKIMFPDQYLSGEFIDDSGKNFLQSTSLPIFNPSSNKNHPDSLMNLLSVSVDDEHSISSSSNSSRRQRLFSSHESDSTTRDSELTFDGPFLEAKLEKIEHDEHFIPHMFVRRSSIRTNYQGQQDEEILRGYNIPLTLYDITQSSTEEYNRHLASLNYLTPEQLHIIKDIRRRGKNKIAAQNCRKRKASSVETLLEEVDELKRVKHELEERKTSFQQQIAETRHLYEYLHHQVLPDRQLPPAIIVK
jgi:hypothetical protein